MKMAIRSSRKTLPGYKRLVLTPGMIGIARRPIPSPFSRNIHTPHPRPQESQCSPAPSPPYPDPLHQHHPLLIPPENSPPSPEVSLPAERLFTSVCLPSKRLNCSQLRHISPHQNRPKPSSSQHPMQRATAHSQCMQPHTQIMMIARTKQEQTHYANP